MGVYLGISLMFCFICLGFVWPPTNILEHPCEKCCAFAQRWDRRQKSEIIKAYGQPSSIDPTDSEAKAHPEFGTRIGGVHCQRWVYEKQRLGFYIRFSDGTVYEAHSDDHIHERGLLGFLWGI